VGRHEQHHTLPSSLSHALSEAIRSAPDERYHGRADIADMTIPCRYGFPAEAAFRL
jgi:hypothetical protein